MKLEDVGDASLVERIARIVYRAYSPEEIEFGKWMDECQADPKSAYEFGLHALDALDEEWITGEQRDDINEYLQILNVGMELEELNDKAMALLRSQSNQ